MTRTPVKELQALLEKVLADEITEDELRQELDRIAPLPEPTPQRDFELIQVTDEEPFLGYPREDVGDDYEVAWIYALLDHQGRRAYVGRSTSPSSRHKQILAGRVKAPIVRMWVKAMARTYSHIPQMVILERTDLSEWYSRHRAWVQHLQEGGEAYLNTL